MLDTENMQIVSCPLALALARWCSRRAAEKEEGVTPPDPSPPLPPPAPVRIGYQKFVFRNILTVQALKE